MFKNALLFVCTLACSGAIYAVETADIAESRSKLHALCDEGKYEAALPVAERIIEELSAEFGVDSNTLAVPYHNKAIIERTLGDFSRAEASFEESIRIARANNGNYSLSLAGVLIEFGAMHYELEQYDLALEKFREAQHIAHRNDGIFTLKQIDAMAWISATVRQGPDLTLMDTQERFYFRIYTENYSPGDIRLLPSMERLGGWFKDSGQFKDASKIHQQSLDLIDALGEDDNDYRKIPILREMSSLAYLSNRCCRNKPLEQVLDIMQGGSGYGDVEELIKATLHLADMKMLSKNSPEADKLYKKAWDLRSGTPGKDGRAQIEFGRPMPLGYSNVFDGVEAYDEIVRGRPTPLGMKTYRLKAEDANGGATMSFTPERPRQKLIGTPVLMCFQQVQEFLPPESGNKMDSYYVELGFSVKQNGSVGRVEVKDSNTPSRLTRYVKKILRSLRYRPKIENGAAVPSEVVVRQTFNDVDARALQKTDMFPERLAGAVHVCKLLTTLR